MFKNLVVSGMVLFGLLPLQAQIDSRLITNTDLLDVYKSTPAKPEVLTVFDFSNSMYAMTWPTNYYVNVTGTNHVGSNGWYNETPDGDNSQFMAPMLDTSGKVYIAQGWGSNGYIPTNNGAFLWPQRMENTGSGRLVKPNGDLVSIGGTYNQSQLEALVRQASHIRMTATYSGVTRTVDLPIPWAIFNPVTGATPSIMTIPDTIGGGPDITPDEAYLSGNPNNIVNDSNYDNLTRKDYYKIGLLHYNPDFLWWVFFGKDKRNAASTGTDPIAGFAVPAGATGTVPWTNGLPGMTRVQALKYAVVSTWLKNQKKVWWGFRYLDGSEQGLTTVSPNNGSASSTSVSRDIRLFRPAQNSSTADPKLRNFVQTVPNTGTPLTYAFANAYTQLSLNKDASSTFGESSGGGQSGTEKPIPGCRNSFLVVFTDGVANDTYGGGRNPPTAIGGGTDVYAQGNAAVGNTNLGTLATALTPGSANRFNIWTLAAVAAHFSAAGHTSPTSTTATPSIGTAAPFLISDRGASLSNKRRIRTMTVGMSLYGNLSDAAGGKSSMYRAALYGNPKTTTWVNPTSANPTPPFDPNIPTQADRDVNPFFFDAQSASQLAASMDAVINEAITSSGSVSAPSAPLVGLSLGREAFLGLFEPAKSGPLWKGDLLAAGLKLSTTTDTFLGNNGDPVTSVNSENALWSAGDLLQSEGLTYNYLATQYPLPATIPGTGPRSWKLGRRKVITNLTGNTLIDLDETTISDRTKVGAADDTERIKFLRFLRGAHDSAETGTVAAAPSIQRGTIMGDIISSSPAVLEYPLSLKSGSPVLDAVDTTSWKEMHFRVIYVGDNQGYVHAFAELGGVTYSGSAPNIVKTPIAAVDEIWAFYPGELLASMPKYLRDNSKAHIYGMDGEPVVYFNDKPGTNEVVGNRVVDGNDDVRVIIGMGKGGRNYYAFDVKDPFSPMLSWKLIPDSSADTVVQKMGLATSTPALSRVEVGGTTKDVAFIGGGLSTKAVDTAMGAPVGRNLVAINVLTGAVEKSWNFSGIANMGSITAHVVPVEFLANTARAQRVYFSDQPIEGNTLGNGARGSAIWALGSTSLAGNGVNRLDSSDINNWTGGPYSNGLRKVYQGNAGQIISTSPVPFRLGTAYPVSRTVAPLTAPSVMGLVFNSGDRNDPLDRDLLNPSGQNQLTVLFDRQDSSSLSGNSPAPTNASSLDQNGFTDADLEDLTAVASPGDAKISPTNASYYLKSKFGYKLLLGAATVAKTTPDNGGPNYYPKAPSSPAALDGVLFFSLLKPGNTFDPVTGLQTACTGTGITDIYRMCNLLAPVFSSGSTSADLTKFDASVANCSGKAVTFANIPGPLTSIGSVGILVSGQGKTSTGAAGTISTAGAEAEVVKGKTQNFGFRVKTWRIIR